MMIQEQYTTLSFPTATPNTTGTCRIHLRLTIPELTGASLSIGLPTHCGVVTDNEDSFAALLRDAIHGGIARAERPLPIGGLSIDVLTLEVSDNVSLNDIERIIPTVVEFAVAGMVSAHAL